MLALPYTPNDQQVAVIASLARFCEAAPGCSDRVFILRGYAGTGKTSLTGALVTALKNAGRAVALLAPTGRAAKVFGSYARSAAFTIHRKIYRHMSDSGAEHGEGVRRANTSRDTVFIVDEASMIGAADDSGGNLLEDLIYYVYSGENCRLILLGDTAQLPPVGAAESPAMNPDILRGYGLKVSTAVLTAIVRQQRGSGILANATLLRRAMAADTLPPPALCFDGYDDIVAVTAEEVPEVLEDAYRRDGLCDTVVITRSNRAAADYNRAIRQNILYLEEELQDGELLIVAKNNYYWTRRYKRLDFIANGDTVSVARVIGCETRYGLRFADVELSLPDRGDTVFPAKLLLSALSSQSAGMSADEYKALYYGIIDDAEFFPSSMPYDKRVAALRDNPYWNALQVKYAYAVTCHKAQGGQWVNVLVDLGYVPPEAAGMEFYRWLYTAVTRASKRLYIINPPSARQPD